MKIFDCFMYFDEDVILDVRLNTLHEYIGFNSSSYLEPNLGGSILNQNIHNTPSNTDFVIICHASVCANFGLEY